MDTVAAIEVETEMVAETQIVVATEMDTVAAIEVETEMVAETQVVVTEAEVKIIDQILITVIEHLSRTTENLLK